MNINYAVIKKFPIGYLVLGEYEDVKLLFIIKFYSGKFTHSTWSSFNNLYKSRMSDVTAKL